MIEKIIIYGNVPSLKNSKDIVDVKKKRITVAAGVPLQSHMTGAEFQALKFQRRSTMLYSKQVREYIKKTELQWEANGGYWHRMVMRLPKPLKVGFRFIRDSNRRFDYINAAQLVQDLMVRYGWITDDNADELLPVFLPYEVDKVKAGVEISIIN
jgi:hypothetical protein